MPENSTTRGFLTSWRWRTVVCVTLLYAAATMILLWPVLTPWTVATRLQTWDSLLMAAIMGHSSYAVTGGLPSFWDFEIFYPLKNTLCLSEPMLLPAVLFAPLIRLMGTGPAHNLWTYFCWFSAAMAMWAYLRHRGCDAISAFWGGLYVAFSPDRMWHAAGHSHLYFQAGFPLLLLAWEKMIASDQPRRWAFALALVAAFQIYAGFYITVLFLMWSLFLLAPAAMDAAHGRLPVIVASMKRGGWIAAIVFLLAIVPLVPVAKGYRTYGSSFPQNSLENTASLSATWAGYALPPWDPARCLSVAGMLCRGSRPSGTSTEDFQYLGVVPLLGLLCGLIAFLGSRRTGPKPAWHTVVYVMAFLACGLAALIFSLGPFLCPDLRRLTRLPFAYLYALVEPLRFFRAPARFAFVVQWSVGIVAALSLGYAVKTLQRRGYRWLSLALPLLAICGSLVEFCPINHTFRISCEQSESSRHMSREKQRIPFVHLPTQSFEFMAQLPWHFRPVANGFSGYAPPFRGPELSFFDAAFPADESLLLLERWGIRRVFVSQQVPAWQRDAASTSPRLALEWRGQDGMIYRMVDSKPRFDSFLADRRRAAHSASSEESTIALVINGMKTTYPWELYTEMQPQLPDQGSSRTRWISTSTNPSITFLAGNRPLSSVLFTRLRMRLSISNWYSMTEQGAIYWSTSSHPDFGEERVVTFPIPADGRMHDIVVEPGELVTWLTDGKLQRVRLDFGGRISNRIEVESLSFEQGPVHWSLR